MYQDQVMVPMGDWAKTRLKKLGKNDVVRLESRVGSGFGKNIANWLGRDMAYPDNVLHFATECSNKNHSAAFPEALPEWFIRLFTQPGGWVLDPFAGSGTTNCAALRLGRNSVGVEMSEEYAVLAEQSLRELTGYQNGDAEHAKVDSAGGSYSLRAGTHPGLSRGPVEKHPIPEASQRAGSQKSLFA